MNKILLVILVAIFFAGSVSAQEFDQFEASNEIANSVFGWDVFSGDYIGPHASTLGSSGGLLSVSPAGGLISSTSNLYAFFTFPSYTVSLSNLDSSEGFTSIVVQIATTEIIDETRFSQTPDDFEFLGERGSLGFDGDDIPINFYWAEWIGMPAISSFEVEITGAEEHVSFCSAHASYFNTAQPLNVTFGEQILLADVNCDGSVNLLDVGPFIELISSGGFLDKADMNEDGSVNLLDVGPFVDALSN